MSADPADYPADGGRAEYGWREQDPHGCPGGDAPPGAVAGRRLVLVLAHLAAGIFRDDCGIVGPDQTLGMQSLDDLVVLLRRRLVRIRSDVNECAVIPGHRGPLSRWCGPHEHSRLVGRAGPVVTRPR